jgi:hypothetical protein
MGSSLLAALAFAALFGGALLVIRNGEIVAGHYRYGRTDAARFLSFSMAKSAALWAGVLQSLGATTE